MVVINPQKSSPSSSKFHTFIPLSSLDLPGMFLVHSLHVPQGPRNTHELAKKCLHSTSFWGRGSICSVARFSSLRSSLDTMGRTPGQVPPPNLHKEPQLVAPAPEVELLPPHKHLYCRTFRAACHRFIWKIARFRSTCALGLACLLGPSCTPQLGHPRSSLEPMLAQMCLHNS